MLQFPSTDVDALAKLSEAQLDTRLAEVNERCQARIKRAQDEQRDLNEREVDLLDVDKHELYALKDALELRSQNEQVAERAKQIDTAIQQHRGGAVDPMTGHPVELPDPHVLIAEAARERRSASFVVVEPGESAEVFTRAVTSATGGVRGGHTTIGGDTRFIDSVMGVEVLPATAGKVEWPRWPALSATQAANLAGGEGAKTELADPVRVQRALGAANGWRDVSTLSQLYGTTMEETSRMNSVEAVHAFNTAFVAQLVADAGAARVFAVDAATSLAGAMAAVELDAGGVPTAIVVASAADWAAIAAGSHTVGADPLGDAHRAFDGVPILLSPGVGAGNALVVHGPSCVSYRSALVTLSAVNPSANTTQLLSEVFWAGGIGRDGVAVLQDIVTP